jgi:hypothetical protein
MSTAKGADQEAIMTRLSILIPAVISACATMDDPGEGDEATAPEDIAVEEAQAQSPAQSLSSPTIVRAGSSTATVISSLSGSYGGLEISGGPELGAFAVATYYPSATSGDVAAAFTVTPAPGSAFVYSLKGTGPGYSYTHLRLERRPGSTDLRAASTSGIVICGTVPSSTPTTIGIALATSARRFSVSINGAATACTNLGTKLAPPITGFEMMDASNAGYGGVVRFEGLAYP